MGWRTGRTIALTIAAAIGFANPPLLNAQVKTGGEKALRMFDQGMAALERKDYREARRLFAPLCDAGVGTACYNLGIMVMNGRGGPVDKTRAANLFLQGCEERYSDNADQDSCFNYGLALEKGWTGAPDLSRAVTYYVRACDLGQPNGCLNAGNMLLTGRGRAVDLPRALAHLKRGCSLGNGRSCYNAGYAIAVKKAVDPDGHSPREYLRLACEAGHEKACR
ncbi:MAG: tetratricopeptide repeat protein [Erythrobacter sp.]|uniref:tetratricopeptide repeat protein n=1 Tax=Erythrobacter sp. TaxID=1042 RepID=UPI0032EC3FEE